MDMTTVAEGIGERVKSARVSADLTQEKLAQATDLSFTTISSIERGTRPPDLETLYKLAEALEVSVCELLEAKNGKAKADAKENVTHLNPREASGGNRKEPALARGNVG